jgi:N-acetylmuramoyl-L-alanine amidase
VRFHWLFPSAVGILSTLLVAIPAEAARLQFWRFNNTTNQLTFTTDDGIQPRAQLISDPTRLVIDLPGTTLGRATTSQSVGGTIREVRVGQFDAQTTRIVIELAPGYTLDPQQVQVQGITPTQWAVQLPTPQPISNLSPTIGAPPSASPGVSTPTVSQMPAPSVSLIEGTQTLLQNVQIEPRGFFFYTTGQRPELDLDHRRGRQRIHLEFENTTAIPQILGERDINRFGIQQIEVVQDDTSVRVYLDLNNASDWETNVNEYGVALVPAGSSAYVPRMEQAIIAPIAGTPGIPVAPPTTPIPGETATIQSVDVTSDGGQLLIRADRAIAFTGGWDRANNAYRIVIPNAQLSSQIVAPQLGANSSLIQARLRQETDGSVVILVQPAAGVQISSLSQPSSQFLVVQLSRGGNAQIIPVPPPGNPRNPFPFEDPPTVPNAQFVVVLDPGHGGPDPGAVGIGGIHEADIVLDVGLQVADLLTQQGVQVVLTRSADTDLDLDPRVQIAERADGDLFVSIHANAISLSRPEVNGIETYYFAGRSLPLAQTMHSNMLQVPGTQDRGVRQARFYVIRNTSMPAVLLEIGFVTGSQDAALLSDPNFRSQMAAAIARGIVQYIQQNF